jgi:hypothetical protein
MKTEDLAIVARVWIVNSNASPIMMEGQMDRLPMPASMPADLAEMMSDPIDAWDPFQEHAERAREEWTHERANQIVDNPRLLQSLCDDWQLSAMPEFWRQVAEAARAGEFRRWLLQHARKQAEDELDEEPARSELMIEIDPPA